MRTCIGCRRTGSPDELVRVACIESGKLVVGRDQPGRGAWLCRASTHCLDQAVKRKAFDRAFRCRVDVASVELIQSTLGGGSETKAGQGSEGSVL